MGAFIERVVEQVRQPGSARRPGRLRALRRRRFGGLRGAPGPGARAAGRLRLRRYGPAPGRRTGRRSPRRLPVAQRTPSCAWSTPPIASSTPSTASPTRRRSGGRIGHTFIEVFRDEAKSIPGARFLAQGTLYPDVIESGGEPDGPAATIKIHHNVGGLPEELGFELIEPLRDLFKDEVRRLGLELGLPDSLVWRHPFPGPGLAVRCLGEVTAPRLEVLRQADAIFLEELRTPGLERQVAQAFAVLLPVQSVGVMGDAPHL